MRNVALCLALGAFLFLSGCLEVGVQYHAHEDQSGVKSGEERSQAYTDRHYDFMPSVDASSSLRFSIENKPSWASFDESTGELQGIPTEAGTFESVRIRALTSSSSQIYDSQPFTIQVVGDPLKKYAWHLGNTGQNDFAANAGLAGNDIGLKQALIDEITGEGVKIAISDNSVEIAHEDLRENNYASGNRDYTRSPVNNSYAGDPSPKSDSEPSHGTSVTGLAAARGWNDLGSRGVAPLASFSGFNFLAVSPTREAHYLDQVDGDFDVFNQSWGTVDDEDVPIDDDYVAMVKSGVTQGRGGKGSIYVRAAGNSFYTDAGEPFHRDSGASPDNDMPYVVVVGAFNAKGQRASYSSIGSNLWVSSPGGEDGQVDPAILTVDETGCSRGFASTTMFRNIFDKGGLENANCNYVSSFNGTSSATPIVSGVAALILQANPRLSWRDVKRVLALSASPIDSSLGALQRPTLDPAGYVWDPGWITNGAGHKFSSFYGFGRVNADAAVAMARTLSPTSGELDETSWLSPSSLPSGSIPDDSATGVSSTIAVSDDMRIEAVQIEVSATHSYTGDLGIELTSPSGTRSVLLHTNNSFGADQNLDQMLLLSNAFYDENTRVNGNGTWTLKVVDAGAQDTGRLTGWRLKFFGSRP
jgi:subtilisin-like proprotein convertase family protein